MKVPNRKHLLRAAIRIAQVIESRCDRPFQRLPVTEHRQYLTSLRMHNKALEKGWLAAADRIRNSLRRQLSETVERLQYLNREIARSDCNHWRASPRDIHSDLLTLEREFESVACRLRQSTLSVTTEPIELEGVYLGRFEIQLDWRSNGSERPFRYRVVALDPNEAASNDSVTHPHVSSELLCEGEGQTPIRNALAQGRLLDFFVLVLNVLQTYNAGSAYVALEDWSGTSCADCGSGVHYDECRDCQNCDSSLCGECATPCEDCSDSHCAECLTECGGCDAAFCRTCLVACADCGTSFCKQCLNCEERCKNCEKVQEKSEVEMEELEPASVE